MLFDTSNISIDPITNDCLRKKNISLSVIRLDKIHPIVSGNKLFKLHLYLEEAIKNGRKGVLTFGGAYSNHLVATAYACKTLLIKSIGIVRGENLSSLSPTLIACSDYGMQLIFISRAEYDQKPASNILKKMAEEYPEYLVIPEGGYGKTGAAGAALIPALFAKDSTHICVPLGTATTFAGLLMGAGEQQQIVGVPVIKGESDVNERVVYLTGRQYIYELFEGYHFGGYAKKNAELLEFMNDFYKKYTVPTDFVYTAKMMFAVLDKVENNFFIQGSKIACLHTGGLQGNQSLPAGSLVF